MNGRRGVSGLTVALVVLVIVSLIVSMGFGLYYLQQTSEVNQLQTKVSTDENQISSLDSQVSSLQVLQTKLTSDEGQISSLDSQISSLQTQLGNQESSLQNVMSGQQSNANTIGQLSSSLQSLQSSLQSIQSSLTVVQVQVQGAQNSSQSNANQLAQIQTEIQDANASIVSIVTDLKNLQPQEPISTLMVIASSFNNGTNTETLTVQNTWNGTVDAQLQATVLCITRPGQIFNCPNPVATYTSNVMQFGSMSTSSVSFKLSQFDNLSSGTMDQLQFYFFASSTVLSPTYTLQYP